MIYTHVLNRGPAGFGQWRLRHELYVIRSAPHAVHTARRPPRAAVRQLAMAYRARC
jgi:hypothetical protein